MTDRSPLGVVGDENPTETNGLLEVKRVVRTLGEAVDCPHNVPATPD
jgi:hypothetical protein